MNIGQDLVRLVHVGDRGQVLVGFCGDFQALCKVGRAIWKKNWPGAFAAIENAAAVHVASGDASNHLASPRGSL